MIKTIITKVEEAILDLDLDERTEFINRLKMLTMRVFERTKHESST